MSLAGLTMINPTGSFMDRLRNTAGAAGTSTPVTGGAASHFDNANRVQGLAGLAGSMLDVEPAEQGLRNDLINTAGGVTGRQDIEEARQRGRQIGDTTAGTFGRDTFALTGVEGQHDASATRRMGLSRVIAEADASNRARLGADDRRRMALEGAAGLATQADAMSLSGMRDAAAAQTQQQISDRERRTASSNARRSTAGAVVGTALKIGISLF